jgi:hypothetical protein
MLPRIALVIAGLLLALTVSAKPSIAIGNRIFFLAGEEKSPNGQLREYLMADETFDHWTHLVAVRRFPKLKDPKAYIETMAKEYHARRPIMQFAVMRDDARKDWIIDFLDYPDTTDGRFMEWNFFRAHRSEQGLIVCQYAVRHYYKEKIDEIAPQLGPTRQAMLGVLLTAEFVESEEPAKLSAPAAAAPAPSGQAPHQP